MIHEETDEPDDRDPRVDVLCGCGWGLLAVPESTVPYRCPMCGRPLEVES